MTLAEPEYRIGLSVSVWSGVSVVVATSEPQARVTAKTRSLIGHEHQARTLLFIAYRTYCDHSHTNK